MFLKNNYLVFPGRKDFFHVEQVYYSYSTRMMRDRGLAPLFIHTGTLKLNYAYKRICRSLLQRGRLTPLNSGRSNGSSSSSSLNCRWLVTWPSVTSPVCRYNKSPSLRSSFSRAQPSAPQHDISNNLTLRHLRPIPCILPEDDSFHFQYMYFFFFLYPRNNCTGWYASGETSLEWSSAVADVHGLWCFWEINAVKHLKHSQWCSMFHLLWKSRTNCRCLKELVSHVRAWQWTSGSFCGGITNPAAWSLSRLPASPSPRWGRMIYVVVASNLNAVILLLLWFNKHGSKEGETQAVSQISYFC